MKSINKYDLIVHCSNIVGKGAIIVVSNILESMNNNYHFKNKKILILLPDIPFWNKINLNGNFTIDYKWRPNSSFLNNILRTFDVIFGHLTLPSSKNLFVLGDLPLRFKNNQILLIHNTLILNNKFDKFIVHKFLLKSNSRFVDIFLVQSLIVSNNLYNFLNCKLNILESPMPVRFPVPNKYYPNCIKDLPGFKFFYPASFYKHKNHQLIIDIINDFITNEMFILTISKEDIYKLENISNNIFSNLKLYGSVNYETSINLLNNCNALFFPSLFESYGLPLLEAMHLGKIIVCIDKPYTRWLCESEAIYFIESDISSIKNAINEAKYRFYNGIIPNWSKPLSKIPLTWDVYINNLIKFF